MIGIQVRMYASKHRETVWYIPPMNTRMDTNGREWSPYPFRLSDTGGVS